MTKDLNFQFKSLPKGFVWEALLSNGISYIALLLAKTYNVYTYYTIKNGPVIDIWVSIILIEPFVQGRDEVIGNGGEPALVLYLRFGAS
jgi:hypothetical protein